MLRSIPLLLILLLGLSATSQIDKNWLLIARNSGNYIAIDGTEVRIMGYTQSIGAAVYTPGPTLRAKTGDSVKLRLFNLSQGPPHTVHLHGLDVNQANDGVPDLSFEVEHDSSGYYYFKAPHPGTYIYHCHVVSPVHVQGGMYGLIIIEAEDPLKTWDDGGYTFDSEYNWLTSEIDTIWHNDSIIDHEHDPGMIHLIPKHYEPNYFLVNGAMDFQMEIKEGINIYEGKDSQILMRLANIGNFANSYSFPAALNVLQISSDGRPLPAPIDNDTLWVFPGERYQLIASPTTEFIDSIRIDYHSLHLTPAAGTQYINVTIEGTTKQQSLPSIPAIALYPNPVNNILNCSILNVDYRVYNLGGELVGEGTVHDGMIEIGHLTNGHYLLEISGSNFVKTLTFQKISSY